MFQLPFSEGVEVIFRGHGGSSLDVRERAAERALQAIEPPLLAGDASLMGAEGVDGVLLASQNLADGLEIDVELAQQQDLLEAKELLALVVAIAVLADPCWLEQTDLVVVAQGARRRARHASDRGDRPGHAGIPSVPRGQDRPGLRPW